MYTPSFPSLEVNQPGSPEQAVKVIELYSLVAELVNTDEYKTLQAAVHYLNKEESKENKEGEAGLNVPSDYRDDASDVGSVCSGSVKELDCDYSQQLKELEELDDKSKIQKRVAETDKQFGKKFRAAKAAAKAAFPTGLPEIGFADRLLEHLNATLSNVDKRSAMGPIITQFDTEDASDDEIAKLAISWVLGRLPQEFKTSFDEAVAHLGESYLQDDIHDLLKEELQQRNFTGELPELHEDLRLGNLIISATDVIVLPFRAEQTGPHPKFGVSEKWRILGQMELNSRMRNVSLQSGYGEDDDYFRRDILERATDGEFATLLQPVLAKALVDNTVELVYSCWAFMLRDLLTNVEQCVADARQKLIPAAAGRLVVRKGSRAARSAVDEEE